MQQSGTIPGPINHEKRNYLGWRRAPLQSLCGLSMLWNLHLEDRGNLERLSLVFLHSWAGFPLEPPTEVADLITYFLEQHFDGTFNAT